MSWAQPLHKANPLSLKDAQLGEQELKWVRADPESEDWEKISEQLLCGVSSFFQRRLDSTSAWNGRSSGKWILCLCRGSPFIPFQVVCYNCQHFSEDVALNVPFKWFFFCCSFVFCHLGKVIVHILNCKGQKRHHMNVSSLGPTNTQTLCQSENILSSPRLSLRYTRTVRVANLRLQHIIPGRKARL